VNTAMNKLEGTTETYKYVGSCATVSVSSKTLLLGLCYETQVLLNCVPPSINYVIALI
jgi:hypothetical protein